MALRDPNPLLATQTVTVVTRALDDGVAGDQSFSGASGPDYPAIVTQQRINHEGLRNRSGTTLGESLWDVLLFADADPAVLAQLSKLVVQGQGRFLIATEPSAMRESGCWYVLAKSYD